MKKTLSCFYTILSVFLLVSCNLEASELPDGGNLEGKIPVEVRESQLQQGLACRYYLDFFKRNLTELPKVTDWPGQLGKPIAQLNHQFGKGRVFDSGSSRGVGMRLTGFLHFDLEGIYNFQALSNDGIIVYIDDDMLLNDPKQHSDRLSAVGQIDIKKPGYYPVTIEYFQRKGTASLKLFWKKPDSEELVPIPKKAYWHE